MKNNFIGFIGLSHLSLTYILAATQKNFNVIAYDEDIVKLDKIKNLQENFGEKNLEKILKKNLKKINFTHNKKILKKCKLVFLSKDIETDYANNANYKGIKKYIKIINSNLPKKIPIIIQSQVYPGFSNSLFKKKREVYYQVETLIFGKAFKRAFYPEQLIVGAKNRTIENSFYKIFLKSFMCPVKIISIEEAELCKIAINLFLASSLTTANLLSEYSQLIRINFNNILPSLKLDKRIGKYAYINPGLGISGGNIERDLITIIRLLKKSSIRSNYFREIIKISNIRKQWVYDKFQSIFVKNKYIRDICIFGLSYKKDNSSLKNSPTVSFLEKLKKRKYLKIRIYDDLVRSFKNYRIFNDPKKALEKSDLLIIMRDFDDINIIKKLNFSKLMKNKIIIDPFGILEEKFTKKKYKYFKI